MKNISKIIAGSALAVAMGVTSLTVFAAAKYDNPWEALAGITGKTVEEIEEEHFEDGKMLYEIAEEEGKLDEFRNEVIEQKKELIEERVLEGSLSRERADEILENIENGIGPCGGGLAGQNNGLGFGRGMMGRGRGMMNGSFGGFGRNR